MVFLRAYGHMLNDPIDLIKLGSIFPKWDNPFELKRIIDFY